MLELKRSKSILSRILQVVWPYWISDCKFSAWKNAALLLALCLLSNYLVVIVSDASNHVMNALAERQMNEFCRSMMSIALGFVFMSLVSVSTDYTRKKLELNWREWLTKHFMQKYLAHRSYYQMNVEGTIDNPDERLSADILALANRSMNFINIAICNVTALGTYAFILWRIWPLLVVLAALTGVAATAATIVFGAKLHLEKVNYNQLKTEANFRNELFHLRTHAESIAFYGGEAEKHRSLLNRFADLIKNNALLIRQQTIFESFQCLYERFSTWLPLLILGPKMLAGQLKIGDLTQAQVAFSMMQKQCSIVVNCYESFAEYQALLERLGALCEAADDAAVMKNDAEFCPQILSVDSNELLVSNLSLSTPATQRALQKTIVQDLSFKLLPGESLAIVGPPGSGKTSILRALCGLWRNGSGKIIRPASSRIMILPQKPYMPLGSLREQLCFPSPASTYSDAELIVALDKVNLGGLQAQFGGLDATACWQDELSPGQQQLLSFARILLSRPGFVILDEASSALDSEHEQRMYLLLRDMNSSFISIAHKPAILSYHEKVLALSSDTTWTIQSTPEFTKKQPSSKLNEFPVAVPSYLSLVHDATLSA